MNDDESQRLIRDAEDYTRGGARRAEPALLLPLEDVPLDVIAERVIAEFLREWDADGAGFFDHRHGARALICRLADAGAVVTPAADGSEHPGAHALRALRAAADALEALLTLYRPGVGFATAIWLRERADQLEAGDG